MMRGNKNNNRSGHGAKPFRETKKIKISARVCRLLTANPSADSMDACNPNPRWTMDNGSLRLAFARPRFFGLHRDLPSRCVFDRTLMLDGCVDHDRAAILEPHASTRDAVSVST
jgi:hypothetical protein